jgi:coenzyme F420-reducing hydrogenase delta subunit
MDQWNVDASLTGSLHYRQAEPVDTALPQMAIFCCTRSAGQARKMTLADGNQMGKNVIFIEGMCSGSFSSRHLLSAFEAGMDAVLVLTCHEGNCHSGSGRQRAVQNVAAARKALEQAHVEPERLQINSMAANMSGQLITVIRIFEKQIGRLADFGE